jgi:hypothetical protein
MRIGKTSPTVIKAVKKAVKLLSDIDALTMDIEDKNIIHNVVYSLNHIITNNK